MRFWTVAVLCCSLHACMDEAGAAPLPPFMRAARRLLRQEDQNGKYTPDQPEFYACPGLDNGYCFFPHDGIDFACDPCCDTGLVTGPDNNLVSCFNDFYTPQKCCDPRSPINLPETPSPQGSTKCAYNRDDTCWGNGFTCNECCTRGWVWVTSANGGSPYQRSCWSDEGNYVGLGRFGDFVPQNTGDQVVHGGEDEIIDYNTSKLNQPELQVTNQGRPMTEARCCQLKPTTRPPADPPSSSPTRTPTDEPTSTPVPTLPPSPAPTAFEIVITDAPTATPTTPSCNKVICPEEYKTLQLPGKYSVTEDCTDYHNGWGYITDGYWQQPEIGLDQNGNPIKWTKSTYPPNIFCTWTIHGMRAPTADGASGHANYPVTVTFDSIDLETNYDWLKVYDGGKESKTLYPDAVVDPYALRGRLNTTMLNQQQPIALDTTDSSGRLPLRYLSCDTLDNTKKCYRDPVTDKNTLDPLVAPSGIMYITFSSDGSLEKRGFNLTFASPWPHLHSSKLEPADASSQYNPLPPLGTTPAPVNDYEKLCEGERKIDTTEMKVGTGIIGTKPYERDSKCSWVISDPGDITLTFTKLDTEIWADFVKVFDAKGEEIAAFSGDTVPTKPIVTSGTMTIRLTSDFAIEGTGFQATWAGTPPKAPKLYAGSTVADSSAEKSRATAIDGLIPIAGSLAGIVLVAVGAIVAYRAKRNSSQKIRRQWIEATKVEELKQLPNGASVKSASETSNAAFDQHSSQLDELQDAKPGAPSRAWEP